MTGNFNVTIREVDNELYLSSMRIRQISIKTLLNKCPFVDAYNRDSLINSIIRLAEVGFTSYGLELFVRGRLDHKHACSNYCRRACISSSEVFRIINPLQQLLNLLKKELQTF